jgi:hypothetical protein
MNQNDRLKLGQVIGVTAFFYDRKVTPEVVSMMVDDLSDLPTPLVIAAFQEYRRNSTNRAFPMPGQIREMVAPLEDSQSAARDAAGRIIAAVSKFGWNNSTAAREYIGSLGWEVVQRQGGWKSVCETLTHDNATGLQAQWRDLAMAVANRAKAGLLDSAPALPEPKLKKLADGLKPIEIKILRGPDEKN